MNELTYFIRCHQTFHSVRARDQHVFSSCEVLCSGTNAPVFAIGICYFEKFKCKSEALLVINFTAYLYCDLQR